MPEWQIAPFTRTSTVGDATANRRRRVQISTRLARHIGPDTDGDAPGQRTVSTARILREFMPYSGFPPVLVVDDVPMIIEVVRAVLGQLGFRDIDTAADGTAALERLRQRRYGLVLSDWNMLPMTGYELLRRVRTDPALRETPFVMMTTQAQADCFPAARRAGVNACLIKPFAPSKLRETIIAVCGNVRPDGAV